MARLDRLVRHQLFHSMPSQTIALTKTKNMADGRESASQGDWSSMLNRATVNEARALRVTEILQDYQQIQRRISQYQANPPQDEYNEVGYSLLRQCHIEAHALLNLPYLSEMLHAPSGPNEAEKRQLQRYIVTLDPCLAYHS